MSGSRDDYGFITRKKPSLGQIMQGSIRRAWRLHKKEIIAGFVTAAVLAAVVIAVGVVFWPLIVALVPAAAAVTIGSALGISAFTAATALAATVYTVVSAAVVLGLSAIASAITNKVSSLFGPSRPYYTRVLRITEDTDPQPLKIGGSSRTIVGGLEAGSYSDDKHVSYSTSVEDSGKEPSKSSSSSTSSTSAPAHQAPTDKEADEGLSLGSSPADKKDEGLGLSFTFGHSSSV